MANDNRNPKTANDASDANAARGLFGLPRARSGEEVPAEPQAKLTLAQRAAQLGMTLPPVIVNEALVDIPTQETIGEPRATTRAKSSDTKSGAKSSDAKSDNGDVLAELESLRSEVDDISRTLNDLNERGLVQDKVFNTLHNELQDYKNDFIYEHLKPVVRPLLFLFDSLEQFDQEMAAQENVPEQERRGGLTPTGIRANIVFFREQLVESLRICEVTPMATPQGEFDPRLQKAVETVQVEPAQDNTIQRVLRSGWYLNGRVFRQAEVVLGRSK